MRHKSLLLAAFILGVSSLVFATTAWSAKKSTKQINSLLEDEKKELKILKGKIARQEKLISSVGKKEGKLLGKLKKIDNQIKLKERELKVYQWNSLINKKKLAKLEKNREANKKELKAQKVLLGKRFRQIYKEGSVSPLKVAFSSENMSDLLQRLKYMELIAEHDADLMADYKDRLVGLNAEKKSLLAVRAKLVRLEKDAMGKQGEFEKAKKDKKYFLRKVKKKKQLGIRTRKELLKASNNLNDLIGKLLTKLVSGTGLAISDKKGRLSLPVKGKILNKFGRQKDKQFASFIVHNGINIKVRTGVSVRSVFDGKVLYTGELEGYGNLVIIGHGKEYHSLYGHLDRINVKQNQVVQTGDIIGLSGDTGSLIGETLYFEMRKNGKPVEPVRWFKTARRK
ncbi:MAG: peptidoglycan DD-metalloendopeptidase family protein [Nitrospina sp.]|jgi:murein hydrolase activator|nr:peptidoglycan DD-metalloendopeptidase family protein [Nitrospina sp.]MBT3414317.1 peptidoglycan DD-metalloendopeptidase family protein [Nitrospina sp.]MBT3856681.1 peptidoglycan DD-metalloendopeptidase family protein [Nitrospina sp.]MBT4105298.1 peptidoglycan DD-metalloendopeptidase family protein [Nitrospina sp.]MBT4390799.1 peptidoglycan DD-metalloendopeptidase family protein [Nitrospina sp.]